jgi:uncharacterized phage protein gp47/JayE
MAGLTPTGFVRKTEQECFDEYVAEARALVSPSLDSAPDTVFGQLAAIHASKLAELWEVLEAVYNAFSPNASGDALRMVASITGTEPAGETYSYVTAQVVCTGSFPQGSIVATVDGDSSARFISDEDVVGAGVSVDVLMVADVAGPVAAPPGTLTVLENPPAGLVSITNALAATLGALEESDAELRLRRDAELEATGAGTVDAIRADVQGVPTVTEVKVYTNRTKAVDAQGRPASSFEVVVVHNNADGVAQGIWNSMPAGIEPYSATGSSGVAIDAEGHQQTVPFSDGTPRRLWARITGTKDPTTYVNDQLVKDTVEQFTEGSLTVYSSSGNEFTGEANIGGAVYRSRIATAVSTVPGVISVATVELSTNGTTWTMVDYQLAPREYLGIAPDQRGIRAADVTVVMT